MTSKDKIDLQEDVRELLSFAELAVYLPQAFYDIFGKRLLQEGYVDCGWLLGATVKGAYYSRLREEGSELRKLYTKSCVPSVNVEIMIDYLQNIVGTKAKKLSRLEEEALVNWIFAPYLAAVQKESRQQYLYLLLTGFMEKWTDSADKINKTVSLKFFRQILYDTGMCKMHEVESVSTYVRDISELKLEDDGQVLYYRGHSRLDYELLPGIKRNDKWLRNENRMYQELRVRCPQNFLQGELHLDDLVEMQHYGLPTRLLDITENPLVALYFACCSNSDQTGEVIILQTDSDDMKYAKSDTVAILAALPAFRHEFQQKLYKLCTNGLPESKDAEYQSCSGKLAAEIKSRNPAFEPRILKKDLLGHVFVTPLRNNPRIMKQDGSFILCGLGDEDGGSLRSLRYSDEKGRHVIFVVRDKERILRELDLYSVNRASLFPEIDDVAEYIKLKYS